MVKILRPVSIFGLLDWSGPDHVHTLDRMLISTSIRFGFKAIS